MEKGEPTKEECREGWRKPGVREDKDVTGLLGK